VIAALAVQAPEARMNVEQARQHLVPLREAAEQLSQIFEAYE
jgi:DNA-binding IclR family transcriptional regulator